MLHRSMLLLLCMALPVASHGEDNCGSMLRTMSLFRGTVWSVQELASVRSVTFTPVDFDVLFVVSIDVDKNAGLRDSQPLAHVRRRADSSARRSTWKRSGWTATAPSDDF